MRAGQHHAAEHGHRARCQRQLLDGGIDLASDGLDTITATITVPYKKQIGKDPVWDLRVGTGGLLRNAFTVTR